MEHRVKGLTLFFANLRGFCQGAGDLCAAVQDCHSDFVGLVETLLDGESVGMYLPPSYTVAACKDLTRHGGGVLLLCRDCLLVDAINCADCYVVGSCEFVAVCFRNIAILYIYRQPSDSDITVIDSLSGFRAVYQLPMIMIIMGDFNIHHQDWLSSTHTSAAGRSLLEFCEYNGLFQLVTESTRSNAILNLVITEYEGHIFYRPHLGTSDHVSLIIHLTMELEIVSPLHFRQVFHCNLAPWSHIRGHFRRHCWDPMYSMSLDDATAFAVQAIFDAQKRYIPASVPHCCRLTVWWNHYCHHTYRAKVRAWESGDQNRYLCAKQIARCTQARALAIYKQKLVEKLSQGSNDHVWWKMTMSLNGLSKSFRRATPDVNVLGKFLPVSCLYLMILMLDYLFYLKNFVMLSLKVRGGFKYPRFVL